MKSGHQSRTTEVVGGEAGFEPPGSEMARMKAPGPAGGPLPLDLTPRVW